MINWNGINWTKWSNGINWVQWHWVFCYLPRWSSQTEMNSQWGVVRSNLHGPETRLKAQKSWHRRFWLHESLEIGTFRLGRSGHRHVSSGTFWIYWLSVWHLNLGSHQRKLFLLSAVSGPLRLKSLCKNNCYSWFRSRRATFIWICNPHSFFPTP